MAKQLVETSGEFELVDYSGPDLTIIHADRPTVVEKNVFTSSRAANGDLKFLANLNDDATDEEFEKYVKESSNDLEFAIEAFKSAFGDSSPKKAKAETVDEDEPEKPKRGRKPAQASGTFTSDATKPE